MEAGRGTVPDRPGRSEREPLSKQSLPPCNERSSSGLSLSGSVSIDGERKREREREREINDKGLELVSRESNYDFNLLV